MPRYAAFLRGVMPVNAKMSDLKKAFEVAGFTDVKTILGSGNVVFSARAASEASLQQRAETAMTERLGRTFLTIIRPIEALRDLLASDPYRAFRLAPGAKREPRGGPPAQERDHALRAGREARGHVPAPAAHLEARASDRVRGSPYPRRERR